MKLFIAVVLVLLLHLLGLIAIDEYGFGEVVVMGWTVVMSGVLSGLITWVWAKERTE